MGETSLQHLRGTLLVTIRDTYTFPFACNFAIEKRSRPRRQPKHLKIHLARIMTNRHKITCFNGRFRIACASQTSPCEEADESVVTATLRNHQCPHRGRGPNEREPDRRRTHAWA